MLFIVFFSTAHLDPVHLFHPRAFQFETAKMLAHGHPSNEKTAGHGAEERCYNLVGRMMAAITSLVIAA